MLIIIIAILVSIFLIHCMISAHSEGMEKFLSGLAAFVFIVGLFIGLFVPVSGNTDWYPTKRTELVSLSDSTVGGSKGFIYVSVSAANVYTFRYEIDSEFGTETSVEFKTATINGSNVVEVEDSAIKTPYLQVYERSGKKTIWTFALATTEYKYVFYVPVGSISREVKLD